MTATVEVPLWLLVALVLLALWATLRLALVPSVRWFFHQRAHRVLEEVRSRFDIEIRPFQLTRRRALVDRLVYDDEVVKAAVEHAEAESMPREVAMERVEAFAREIVPAFNAYFYFRVGYGIARRVARLLFRVRLGYADHEGHRQVPPNAAVVFVINHRSNMDYVLVAYLAAARTSLSYAVGEWARVWPLESLLKSMGAFFVRRRSRNALYRKVLRRYVELSTAAGVPQAVFPEGGLTRDGTLRPPRLGLLDYMLAGFDPGGERDLIFVPVGVNYDRVLEDRSLLRSADPKAEQASTVFALKTTATFALGNLGQMLLSRWFRFGYACINFGTPISMQEWLGQRHLDLRGMESQQRFRHVGEVADELMTAIGALVPVVPVALVATVFVADLARPFDELELKGEVDRLVRRLEANGAHVYIPRSDRDYAVTVGLRMLTLRRLVEEREGLFHAVAAEEAMLRYYASSIGHLLPTTVREDT